MKITFRIVIIISLVLIILVGFQLVDSYVSLNFDPDNFTPNKWQRDYSTEAINSKILWLWIFFGYLLGNIIISFRAIRKKKTFSGR